MNQRGHGTSLTRLICRSSERQERWFLPSRTLLSRKPIRIKFGLHLSDPIKLNLQIGRILSDGFLQFTKAYQGGVDHGQEDFA
jgi:hypothetical protein